MGQTNFNWEAIDGDSDLARGGNAGIALIDKTGLLFYELRPG